MAFDQLLKRNFWAVVLVLIAIAAFLHAHAIGRVIENRVAPDEALLAAAPPVRMTAPSASAAFHSTNADGILERNPFDSVTGPLNKPPSELDDAGAAAEAGSTAAGAPTVDNTDPMNAPSCDGVKVIIIAASPDPDWSFAAFAGSDGKSVLRRRGGDAGNGKTVEFVGWDRVWLTGGGSGRCQARMFAPPEAAPTAAKPVVSAAPAAAAGPGIDPSISKGIQKVSATEFNIDRSVVDKILENQAELMKQARIVPEQENGKMVGIRLFGVRPDTLLGVLGMNNGDRLQTINGFDMTSPEKALEAYARLRTADKLTVQVNRGGQNVNLDYNIK
jgi:general secretion pathway protein C